MYHLTGVTKCYRSGGGVVRALDGIGLCVEDGGALVVQGAAGSGKSTLLRILGGLERPTRGSVELDGTDLATLTECRLARIRTESIGTVPSGGGLTPGFTARQNVAGALLPLRLRPADRWELAGEALREVGMDKQLDVAAEELAAGARQRVALARALVKRPTVLLADRPTAGLDAAARAEIAELFVRVWGERRLTCVVATEDAALVGRAPRLATLSEGRVAAMARYPSAAAGG
ncbi:ABC transporter ATP-binding protein [Streptomyces sp. NPDC053427]|uniref:ABC transporter ATP-binding protein n=1 Tax=Streptomyces sp. NPDC053427 TaxID=3365701 RepID=UPI0037CD4FEB